MGTTHVLSSEQDRPANIAEILDDPDDIGTAEYRTIYEMLEGSSTNEPGEVVRILKETISWANYMIGRIQERYQLPDERT